MARLRILFIALLFLAGQRPALACSCVPFTKPQVVDRANVIFTGTATTFSRSFTFSPGCAVSSADPVSFTFEVATVYKGDLPRTVNVNTVVSGASCGFEFQTGKTYTVFATAQDDRLETGLCTGTTDGVIDAAEYGLAAGRPPRS